MPQRYRECPIEGDLTIALISAHAQREKSSWHRPFSTQHVECVRNSARLGYHPVIDVEHYHIGPKATVR